MSINLINYALAKKDWKKAYEDLKVLEIGGRNLIRNSRRLDRDAGFLGAGHTKEILIGTTPYGTEDELIKLTIADNTNNNVFRIRHVVRELDYYTFSIWYKSAVGGANQSFSIDINDSGGRSYAATDEWQKGVLTVNNTRVSDIYHFVDITVNRNHSVLFYLPKLEKGNKATDWTPAPEDIKAHPFVAELAETVFRSKQNEKRIRDLETH